MSTDPVNPELLLKKLRWQCRRGMKEMDALLIGWLDRCFVEAAAEKQQLFVELLRTEDDVLWRWLAGRAKPEEALMAELIDEVVSSAQH